MKARKKLERSLVEMASFNGKKTGREYLVVRGHVNKATFFQAFAAVELKEAVLDVLGRDNSLVERAAINSTVEARKIWKARS